MKKYDVIIGIDIGLSGGISFFDVRSGEVLSIYEMPIKKHINSDGKEKNELDLEKLKFILEIPKVHLEDAIVVFEDVHAFPGQGVVAVGTLLEQKGIIRGLAMGLGYDELAISPKTWQKYFDMIPPEDLKGSTAVKTKTLRKKWLKGKSLELARNYFPEWAETRLSKPTSHGLSDSLLLGLWYMENPPK